jgi:multidrug efflux pump subunit AcrA (membrane-fusion protein)
MKTVIGIALAAVALFVSAAEDLPKGSGPATKPALTVNVSSPTQLDINQRVWANGSIAAWQEAVIGAEANGLKITEVRVNVGDRVKRGDVIAVLQSDTLKAELAQAEATLAEANASALDAACLAAVALSC